MAISTVGNKPEMKMSQRDHQVLDVDIADNIIPLLSGNVVCFSGFDSKLKEQLVRITVALGGLHCKPLTTQTTILVTDSVGSEKYIHAVALHIPIVRSDWLLYLYKYNQLPNIDLSDAFNYFQLAPLQGLIISSSGLSKEVNATLETICVEYGANFSKNLTETCTHLITTSFKGKKVSAASKHDILIVHPMWIIDSLYHGAYLYPEEYIIHDDSNTVNENEVHISLSKIPEVLPENAVAGIERDTYGLTQPLKDSSSKRNIDNIIPINRNKRSKLLSNNEGFANLVDSLLGDDDNLGDPFRAEQFELIKTSERALGTKDSSYGFIQPAINLRQHDDDSVISYIDPHTDKFSENAMSRRVFESSFLKKNIPIDSGSTSKDLKSTIQSTPMLLSRVKFLFTSIDQNKRGVLTRQINALGGSVLESSRWDDSCTHLLSDKLTKTEKCLAAIASGKWCLKLEYIDECVKHGKFVNPERFEWKKEDARSDIEEGLYGAPHWWRIELDKRRNEIPVHGIKGRLGAFSGWRVLLITELAKKRDGFKTMLLAGGAKVVIPTKPYEDLDLSGFDFCLTDCDIEDLLKNENLKKLHDTGMEFKSISVCSTHLYQYGK